MVRVVYNGIHSRVLPLKAALWLWSVPFYSSRPSIFTPLRAWSVVTLTLGYSCPDRHHNQPTVPSHCYSSLPTSPGTASLHAALPTPSIYLQNDSCTLSIESTIYAPRVQRHRTKLEQLPYQKQEVPFSGLLLPHGNQNI